MLDRSIPFYNTIMRCDSYEKTKIILPEGYRLQPYQPGFENGWAQMECEIGDFDSLEEAKQYFAETYLSKREEFVKRSVFLTDETGNVVGSCFAWKDPRGEEMAASLHWLVVSTRCQGKGLGRAICQRTMEIFAENGELPVYIHTQPWSWKAILLYLSLGFWLQKTDSFSHYENQYGQVMETLKNVVGPEQYRRMEELSAE